MEYKKSYYVNYFFLRNLYKSFNFKNDSLKSINLKILLRVIIF